MASLATWRRDLDLDRLEDEQKLPRGLLSSVLRHESAGDPNATSKAGAGGLFQLMAPTAAQYGADPYNPQQSATAAARELGSHWKRYGGDLSQTLAAWNWGSGNLQRKGMENAPTETRNFIRNVSGALGDRYAAAGDTVTDMPRSQGSKTTGREELPPWIAALPERPPSLSRPSDTVPPLPGAPPDAPARATVSEPWIDALPDRPPPAGPPAAAPAQLPLPPTATSTPEQDSAYRASRAQPQRVDPGQFMQQQAPAAVQAMQPPAYTPSGLPPEQQTLSERLAASEAGQNPNAPPAPSLPAQGVEAVKHGASEFDPLWGPKALSRGMQDPYWLRKGVKGGIELGADVATSAVGAGAGFAVGGVPGMIAGPVIAQGALDRARMQLGLRPKEKAVFETGLVDIYQTDLINGGMALLMGAPDLVRSALGKTYAGKAMLKADTETKAAHDAWQAAEVARKEKFDKGQTRELGFYDERIATSKAAYDAKVQERAALVAKNQAEFDQATTDYQTNKMRRDAEVQDVDAANYYNTRRFEEEQKAYPAVRAAQVAEAEAVPVEKAAARVREVEAGYQEKLTTAQADTKAHQEALERAQMLPEIYKPTGDASDVKYQRLRDVGKDEVVGVDTAKADLKQFLDEDYKHYLDESNAALPEQVKFHADQLAKRPEGEPVSVLAVHDAMKELGPLTRSKNGDVRRTASVLYGIYSDMLEQSPKVAELARDASQTFKREMAVKELSQRVGIGTEGTVVSRHPQGGYQINTKALQDRFDKAANNKLFRGAFDDEEWAALRKDIDEFSGTPKMPRPVTPPTKEQLTIAPEPAKIPPESPPEMAKVIPYPKELGPEPTLKDPGKPIGPFAPPPFAKTRAGSRTFEGIPEPKAIEAQLDSPGFRGFVKSTIGQGSSIGGMAYMLSRAGLTPTAVDNVIYLGLGSIAAGAVGTTMNYAVSKALMTPSGRTLLKAAMGPGGKLDPNFLGGLIAVMSAKERAEFVRDLPKEPEKKRGGR